MFKDYTVYNSSSGKILRTGRTSPELFKTEADKSKGESIIEGCFSPLLYKIINNLPVELNDEEKQEAMPSIKPSEQCVKQITNKEYQSILIRLDKLEGN